MRRASHRKSRAGCAQCKRLHVKCNEFRPRCTRCERLDLTCEYPVVKALMSSSLSASTKPSPVPYSTDQKPLSMLDLEIYHSFIFQYSRSSLEDGQKDDKISRRIVDTAFQHGFVLHSSLALAALSLFQQHPSRTELWERACYLQSVAIEQVQPVLRGLTEDDAIAALIFSSNTAAFSRVEYMLNPHDYNISDPIDKMIESFQLSRGVSLVASKHWPYLQGTWIIMNVPHAFDAMAEETAQSLKAKIPSYSSVKSLACGQEDRLRRQVCLETTEKTFRYIALLMKDGHKISGLKYLLDAWTTHLPEEFRRMLEERKPTALIILAYYGVMISLLPQVWHLKGWPELLIRKITVVLGPEWQEFLRWPQEMVLAQRSHQDDASAGSNQSAST